MVISKQLEAGQKFNRLTVIKLDHIKQEFNNQGKLVHNREFYLCKCDCGKTQVVRKDLIKSNIVKSCGCLAREKASERCKKLTYKHGKRNTKLYNIWFQIKERCNNKNNKNYKYYGARNIKICDEWLDNFTNFYNWSIKNGYSEGLSIDRINVDGDYEPNNCRWVTPKEQSRNKTSNKRITINGQTKILTEWLEHFTIPTSTYYRRIYAGKSEEQALTIPIRKKKGKI